MKLDQLTPEQRETLKQELAAQEQAKKEAKQKEIETYKILACDAVDENFPVLVDLAEKMKASKSQVYDNFAAIIASKGELYGIKNGQQSHSFTNEAGTKRVKIGYNMLDKYDDTAEVGITKVREYVQSLANSPETEQLVGIILDLLAKDSKGTLKASRIVTLKQYAEKSKNNEFIDGVNIIIEAYKPERSKMYIRAEYRDTLGKWVPVPSSITEC